MNIVTLKSNHQEKPLLPPGVYNEDDHGTDPVAKLIEDFQRWESDRNYSLSDMSNSEIYQRLHKLGGRSHNPLICEQAYQKLLGLRESKVQNNVAPLLPIELNHRSK